MEKDAITSAAAPQFAGTGAGALPEPWVQSAGFVGSASWLFAKRMTTSPEASSFLSSGNSYLKKTLLALAPGRSTAPSPVLRDLRLRIAPDHFVLDVVVDLGRGCGRAAPGNHEGSEQAHQQECK